MGIDTAILGYSMGKKQDNNGNGKHLPNIIETYQKRAGDVSISPRNDGPRTFVYSVGGATGSGKSTILSGIKKDGLVPALEGFPIEPTKPGRVLLDSKLPQISPKKFDENKNAGKYLMVKTTRYRDSNGVEEPISYGVVSEATNELLSRVDGVLDVSDPHFLTLFQTKMQEQFPDHPQIRVGVTVEDPVDLKLRINARITERKKDTERRLGQVQPQFKRYRQLINEGFFHVTIANRSRPEFREIPFGAQIPDYVDTLNQDNINTAIKIAASVFRFTRHIRSTPRLNHLLDNEAEFDPKAIFVDEMVRAGFLMDYNQMVEMYSQGNPQLRLQASPETRQRIKHETGDTRNVDVLLDNAYVEEVVEDKQRGITTLQFNDGVKGMAQKFSHLLSHLMPDYKRDSEDGLVYALGDKASFDKREYIYGIELKF